MDEGTDAIMEDHRREMSAYRTSGPWFLTGFLGIGLGAVLFYLLGVELPGAIVILVGLVLLPVGVYKHGKAGGDTTGMHGVGGD